MNYQRKWNRPSADTERDALGFRFGGVKAWSHPISRSWRPTITTTTAFSSPHGLYQ
jgi:hypothetical protein